MLAMTDTEDAPLPVGWRGYAAERWLHNEETREQQLRAVADELFVDAALQPGESVLDIGCGTGPTSVIAADQVAPDGRVVGLDVSALLIDTARQRYADHPAADRISWLVGDAQDDHGLAPVDAVISRFGVMFFDDPGVAFGRLAAGCRTGGRLAIAVWQRFDRAEIFAHPFRVVRGVLDDLGVDYQPPVADGGQWSLGDPERLTALLTGSGWSEVNCRPCDRPLRIGGAASAETAAEVAMSAIAPLPGILQGQPDRVHDEVRARLLADFTERHDGTGVPVSGGFMIVTARRR